MLLDDKLRGKIGATCVTMHSFVLTCSVRCDLVSFTHFSWQPHILLYVVRIGLNIPQVKRLLEPAFILIDCPYLSTSSSGVL